MPDVPVESPQSLDSPLWMVSQAPGLNALVVALQQHRHALDAGSGEIVILGSGLFTNQGGIVLGAGGLLTVAATQGFAQSQTGTLNVAIAGTTAALKGRVVVSFGSASVGGALAVSLGNGFVPALFSSNEFLTVVSGSQAVTGQFDQVTLPPQGSDQKYVVQTGVRYLRLGATSTADFNSDFTVDFFDYLDFVDAFSIGC